VSSCSFIAKLRYFVPHKSKILNDVLTILSSL